MIMIEFHSFSYHVDNNTLFVIHSLYIILIHNYLLLEPSYRIFNNRLDWIVQLSWLGSRIHHFSIYCCNRFLNLSSFSNNWLVHILKATHNWIDEEGNKLGIVESVDSVDNDCTGKKTWSI